MGPVILRSSEYGRVSAEMGVKRTKSRESYKRSGLENGGYQ